MSDVLTKIKALYGLKGLGVWFVLQEKIKAKKGILITNKYTLEKLAYDISGELLELELRNILNLLKNDSVIVIRMLKDGSHKITLTPKEKKEISARVSKPKSVIAVYDYMVSKGVDVVTSKEEAEKFYNYWEERGWKRKGKSGYYFIQNWKATASKWIGNMERYRESVEDDNVPYSQNVI